MWPQACEANRWQADHLRKMGYAVVDADVKKRRTALGDDFSKGSITVYGLGLPCQPWSQQGNKHGPRDPRVRGLVKAVCAFLDANRPRVVILEGVPVFAGNSTASGLRRAFREGGYRLTEFTVNARLWVPQSRLRFYMVAVVAEHAQKIIGG